MKARICDVGRQLLRGRFNGVVVRAGGNREHRIGRGDRPHLLRDLLRVDKPQPDSRDVLLFRSVRSVMNLEVQLGAGRNPLGHPLRIGIGAPVRGRTRPKTLVRHRRLPVRPGRAVDENMVHDGSIARKNLRRLEPLVLGEMGVDAEELIVQHAVGFDLIGFVAHRQDQIGRPILVPTAGGKRRRRRQFFQIALRRPAATQE